MFSKLNFIVPLGTDNVVKIRNNKGVIVHFLRDPTCTISVKENTVTIKQSAESTTVKLQFSSHAEAKDAHILLRDIFKQVIHNSETQTSILLQVDFVPPLTSAAADAIIDIPVTFVNLISLYVNGVLIPRNNYTYSIQDKTFTWLRTNPYILDPTTDIITIIYK